MKRFPDKLILIFLIVALLAVPVHAADEQPPYLQQERSNTCTLCSATMLLRNCLYRAGSEDWQDVTEADVRSHGWTSAGLSWNWDYETGPHSFTLAHKSVAGIAARDLEALLLDHPEGIVLYCGGSAPHAVFLTDYTDGVFYCADPAKTYAGSRIPLADSLLGTRHGSQSDILDRVTAYWYISESRIRHPMQKPLPVPQERIHRVIRKTSVVLGEKY